MKKRFNLFAIMLALVLLLTGCGGKTETASDISSSKEPGIEPENQEEIPEESPKTNTNYWVDTTQIAIEMPGQFELESQITDLNYEILSTANSTADLSYFNNTEGCDEGYMQTVITAKNIYRYADLPAGNMLCIKFCPVDLYTGIAFEDYTPDDDYDTQMYTGTDQVFDTHTFTTTVDGTDYDISWYMEGQQNENDRTEVYYITHPIEYNGIGFMLSGGWNSSTADVIARADEVGGWPNMRMEDYFEFLSTPHLVDCRN